MAYNIITAGNSRSTQLLDIDGYASLFVTTEGYIATFGISAYVSQGGNAIVTVKGTILSDSGFGVSFEGSDRADNPGSNTLNVASSGLVQGYYGLYSEGDYTSVRNEGTIASSTRYGDGMDIYGYKTFIENAGLISGYYAIYNIGTSAEIENRGDIRGVFAIYNTGDVTVVNSGAITGQITCFGALTLRNSGMIDGNVFSSTSGDAVINSGQMRYLLLGAGSDDLVNLTGGVITGGVVMGGAGDSADTGDVLTNSGTIIGYVGMGAGADAVDTSNGRIDGPVYLDEGDDTYTGGDFADRVYGGAGQDTIELGDGRDVYRATDGDGNDDLDGGDGVDTYNASAVTTTITLNLGAATTGNAVGNDTIAGFENVIGGSAADNLSGDDGANRIDGQDGADVIFGDSGNDRLIGGLGTDTITGGAGRDILTGGDHGSLDSDKFVFAVGDSGATASTRDVITDFRDHRSNVPAMFLSNPDQINLSAIDANTGVAGDQAFSFNETGGAAFSGAAGSLIWRQFTGFALISGDTNGDGTADFVIQLNGTHGLFTSDFVL